MTSRDPPEPSSSFRLNGDFMKYLCLAYGDENEWKQLTKAEQEELLKQDEVLRQRGDLVAAVDSSTTTVRAWDGVAKTTDGGFAESRVPLAGFSIIEAPDLERAIELVADTPCARAKGAVEVRPIDQINDHGTHAAGVLAREPRVNAEPTPAGSETILEHARRGGFPADLVTVVANEFGPQTAHAFV